ncbi:hypothetical protein Cme02nite_38110 [Catellatospora methionotrophica]|uniref:Uncharacterized protein n=1 Tax=Catellatospora methionotrophica TaxID=121620 RepID=A0A8J3LBT8_9ACTN|nr:hypothetical protein [Catellatospora methionotrophica]GIG15479.1 hypothetical protein Cme02nite_38110 [Catellatospora methionotrophica]
MHRYKTWNGPAPTTAAQVAVTTGTSIKTMLQVATPSTRQLQLISWGFSLTAPPATTSTGIVELLDINTAATVTAHVAAGVQPLTPGQPASLVTLGASATGYTSSNENTPGNSRVHDVVEVPGLTAGGGGLAPYSFQWMPDERPIIDVSRFLRVRVTFAAAVSMITWICWDE